MFLQLYRLLSVYSLLRLPKRRGAGDSRGVTLPLPSPAGTQLTKRSATVAFAAERLDSLGTLHHDDDTDVDPGDIDEPDLSFGSVKDNIVHYVSGFVLRHCKKMISCHNCFVHLASTQNYAPQAALTNVKLRGALHWPSDILFKCLCDVENTVGEYTKEKLTPFVFSGILEESLPALLPLKSRLCADHGSLIVAEILVYYICTRLHWHAKTVSKDLLSRKMTKNNRKKAKLC